jgi:UDP-glucose 4-epimerase
MKMNIVVTGATSFLGQHLIKFLEDKNVTVFAIVRPSSGKKDIFNNLQYVKTIVSDLNNIDQLPDMIFSADYFVHMGWDGIGYIGRSNEKIQNENVLNAISALKIASKLKCKAFVFSGSQAEYGYQEGIMSETNECKPVTQYGIAKLKVYQIANKLAEELHLKYYHVRFFSVYGIGDHRTSLITNSIITLCSDEDVFLSTCENTWNYLWAPDAAYLLYKLLLSNVKSGIYNIASHDTRQLKYFVNVLQNKCKLGRLNFGTFSPYEKIVHLNPDIAKLESVVGTIRYKIFEEGIDEMIELYKTTGEI